MRYLHFACYGYSEIGGAGDLQAIYEDFELAKKACEESEFDDNQILDIQIGMLYEYNDYRNEWSASLHSAYKPRLY